MENKVNNDARITSILKATHLDTALTGIPTFYLSELQITTLPEVELPQNRRLGHLVERIVSELINASENYTILHENLQIIDDKHTIGELDFIIQHKQTTAITHLELAYKFYLYDPTLSSKTIECWIGPNRRDALHEKLQKLQQKQFPLLYHEVTQSKLPNISVENVTQKLCVLTYLFVPYNQKIQFSEEYQKVIKGYYVDFHTFIQLHDEENVYYLPTKKEWGIDPAEHTIWLDYKATQTEIKLQLQHKHTPLCWKRHQNSYEQFFVTWW
ncbi:MAG: DUF1853 family protein [Bacteroidota bacterium]